MPSGDWLGHLDGTDEGFRESPAYHIAGTVGCRS
jgi:hypothetical protein